MKITGVYIDGFGIFHDQSISGLDKNILLFYGLNEAGKSTFLSFIRSILFGFPRANSKDPSCPPLVGGIHGGRIDLLSKNGDRWSVSRKPGAGGGSVAVTGRNCTTCDKAVLDQLLGGISSEAFRNLMAFGLGELQSIETLSGEHIASAIYGAGFGTSMMAMPRARKTIHDQMARIFLKSGSKPALNSLVRNLEQNRKALHDASLQSGLYDATCGEIDHVEKAVSICRNELSLCRQEQRQYDAMERLWPDWITLKESFHKLIALGERTAVFPEEGLPAMDRLTETRDRNRAALSELTYRHERISTRIAALPVDENALRLAGAIGSLVENRNAYLENIRKLPLLVQEKQTLSDTINRLMQRLGSRWNETTILKFDRSLFTREIIRKHKTALAVAERDLAATEALRADKQSSLQHAVEARLSAEKEVVKKGDPPPERNPDLIRKLKQGRDRFADNLVELGRVSVSLEEAKGELLLLENAALQSSSGTKWPVAVVGSIGLAAVCLTLYFGSYRDAAILMGGVVAAACATWVYRKQQRQMRQYRQTLVRQQELRVEDHQAVCCRLESAITSYSRLAEELLDPSEQDSLYGEMLLEHVDRFISNLFKEAHQRDEIFGARRNLLEKTAAEEAAGQALEKVLAVQNSLAEMHAEEKTFWERRCRSLGLSASLSPATALEALDTIEQTVETIQTRDRCTVELSRTEDEINTYRQMGRQTLVSLGWPAISDDILPQTVTEMATRLEESKLNRREKESLGREIANIEKERAALELTLLETESDIRNLLESANTTDEAAFRTIGRIELKRAALQSAAEVAEGNMQRISGELDTTRLQTRLESLSLAEIKARKEEAAKSAGELDLELSGLYTRRAELKQTLETLCTSDDISRLRAEEADLLAEMETGALEWSRYALAGHLITQAREVFERKHQPAILQDAGSIFSRMTDGGFQGVVAPLGENTLSAVNKKGQRISPDLLSRGTAEQLYLAVRFSYLRHQARKGDPLPVVMDDILVNFDPLRARKAAEAIINLSSSHQVLLFTCHPETKAIFLDIDPWIPVYRFDGGQILAPEHHPSSEKN